MDLKNQEARLIILLNLKYLPENLISLIANNIQLKSRIAGIEYIKQLKFSYIYL